MQWIFSLFEIFVAIFPIVENGIQIWNAINIKDIKFSIKTVIPSEPQSCGKLFTGTNDDLVFTFCDSDQCCSMGEIQLTNGSQGSNDYAVDYACCNTPDCNTPDVFGSSQQGDCKGAKKNRIFGSESIITGNVTLSNIDALRGEWVKVSASDDPSDAILCIIDGGIDGDNNIPNESNVPKYQDFSCKRQGRYIV